MARITVEDCIDKFPSRFELVLVASNRARKLHSGETPTVEKDNDKHTVIALREIAQETLTSEQLKNDLIEEYQTVSFTEDEELDEIEQIENSDEASEENEDSLPNNEDNLTNTANNINESSDNIDEENEDNKENLQTSEDVIDE